MTPPLGTAERRRLYARLASLGARVWPGEGGKDPLPLSDEEALALAAEESRFDYRLLYVLVELVSRGFPRFHPFRLREAVRVMRTPAVWGVIFEFARKLTDDRDLADFASIVLRDVRPAPLQLFYNNLRAPDVKRLDAEAAGSTDEFSRWGFYGNEAPLFKELSPRHKPGTYSPESRRRILRRLLRAGGEVKVSDYLSALHHAITRQQAHKDLISFPGIRALSDRRGRRYRLGAPRR